MLSSASLVIQFPMDMKKVFIFLSWLISSQNKTLRKLENINNLFIIIKAEHNAFQMPKELFQLRFYLNQKHV